MTRKIIYTFVAIFVVVPLLYMTTFLPLNENKSAIILSQEEHTEAVPILLPDGYLEWPVQHDVKCFDGLYKIEFYEDVNKWSSNIVVRIYANNKLSVVQYGILSSVTEEISGNMSILLDEAWHPFDTPVPNDEISSMLYVGVLYDVIETLNLAVEDEEIAKKNCLESLDAVTKKLE